jgi:hypothetical protein
MSKINLNAVLGVGLVLLMVLGCRGLQQSSSPSSGPTPRTQTDNAARRDDRTGQDPLAVPQQQPQQQPQNPFPEEQQPVTQDQNRGGDNSDPSVLYGTWQSSSQWNGMQCHVEYIYESTGTYSSLASCDNGYGSSLMTRSVGTWRLIQPGVIRIEYTDHEPKEFAGRPVYYPTGETVTFSVTDRNHLDTSGGTLVREN